MSDDRHQLFQPFVGIPPGVQLQFWQLPAASNYLQNEGSSEPTFSKNSPISRCRETGLDVFIRRMDRNVLVLEFGQRWWLRNCGS